MVIYTNIFQPFNGVHCTAIALIALLSFMQFFPHFPDRISREFIDGIIFDGNDLYREIVSQPGGPMGYLSHRDLPTRVELFDGNIEFTYDMFYGTVNGALNNDAGEISFENAIYESAQISPFLLTTFGTSTVSLIVDMVSNNICMFDSHQRNVQGFQDPTGNAVFLRFDSLNELFQYVNSVYCGVRFDITPVRLLSLDMHAHRENSQSLQEVLSDARLEKSCQMQSNNDFLGNIDPDFEKEPSSADLYAKNFHSYCVKG